MVIQYTAEYPSVAPGISLESICGVTEEECETLVEDLLRLAEENLDTQMIFTLASYVQEWMVSTQQAEEDRRINPSAEEAAATVRLTRSPEPQRLITTLVPDKEARDCLDTG